MEKSNKNKNKCTISTGSGQHESKINKTLNFYNLNGTFSSIACHGRPTPKDIKSFKLTYGINFVLTLQNAKEKPEEVKKWCEENNLKWSLVELEGANLSYFNKSQTKKLIVDALVELYQILKNEKLKVFIHCAAGVHRTGTIIYSLLRIFGETQESALKILDYIRHETRENVGLNRIEFANKNIIPAVLKNLKDKNLIQEENALPKIDAINLNFPEK